MANDTERSRRGEIAPRYSDPFGHYPPSPLTRAAFVVCAQGPGWRTRDTLLLKTVSQ
jgi:hypothetical protein